MRPSRITYQTVLENLADAIPALEPIYRQEVASWAPDDVAPIVFVELHLVPYLVQQLKEGNQLEAKRCLSFLEELAASSDTHLQELVGVAVGEPLLSDRANLDLTLQAAGPKLRKLIVTMRDWPRA